MHPTTTSQEPVFVPKLQTYFADFPCVRSLDWPELTKLGHLLRIMVRAGGKIIHSAHFSRIAEYVADHALGTILPALELLLQIN